MKSDKTVREALTEYYRVHDFGENGIIKEKITWIKIGPISFPLPNSESRRNNVYLHDISHIVTENDTTLKGESSVSAWEVATGGWGNLYFPWLLSLGTMGFGALVYPGQTSEWFEKGRTMRNAFTSKLSKEELYNLTLEEIKIKFSNHPRNTKSPFLWTVLSILVFLLPFFFVGIVIALIILLFLSK